MRVKTKTGARTPKSAGVPPEEARFSAQELQAINARVRGTAPVADAEPVLRLLPVSPWRVHAFWSVTAEDWEAAQRQLPPGGRPAVAVLRFFDFTPLSAASRRPHPPFDVEVQGDRGGWYVDLWKDGKTYVAELGLLGGDHFVQVARSNPVELPPAGPSPDQGFEWREVIPPATALAGAADPPRAVPELFRAVFPRRPVDPDFPLVPPETIGLAAAEAVPLPTVDDPEPAAEDPELAGFPLAACGAHATAAADSAEAEAVAMIGDPAALALAPMPAPEAALPLESLAALSSFSLGAAADFELNAELHIYGRARPGATLSLYGRPVEVGPDGTFSIRRPLPGGALVLPVLLSGGGDGGGK